MDISLNKIDNVLISTLFNSPEYNSFCEDIDSLELINNNDIYIEAVTPGKSKLKDRASTTLGNTKDSIKAAGNIYSNTTDAGGAILNASWRVVASALKLSAKILKWISKHIAKVPMYISKTIDNIGDIPENIKNKVRGNIKLYITVDDIQNLFAKTSQTGDYSVLYRLNLIIKYMDKLSKGDLWTTYFSRKTDLASFFKQFNDDFINPATKNKSDIAIIRQITDQYKYISNIKFTQSVIEMNNAKVVDRYFGKNASIKVIDINNNQKEVNYIEALNVLMEFIVSNKQSIENLYHALENKLDLTYQNDEFLKMNKNSQKIVTEFFQTVSKLIEVIGNIIKCIVSDVKTIENSNNQFKAAKTRKNYEDKNKKIAEGN